MFQADSRELREISPCMVFYPLPIDNVKKDQIYWIQIKFENDIDSIRYSYARLLFYSREGYQIFRAW